MRPASTTLLLLLAAPAARPSAAAAIDVGGPCDASFPPAPPGVLDALALDALDLDDGSGPLPEGTATPHPRELRIALPNDRRAHAPLCRDPHNALRIDARRLDRCPPGHCYSCSHQQCFHLTSFECNAEISTTCVARPTPRPTIRMAETTLPVKLTLRNVPRGYQIKDEHRSSILRWVFEMLTERLVGTDLTLVRVAYAGTLADDGNGNKDTVGVKGPRPEKDKGGRRTRRLRGPNAGSLYERRLAQVDIALRVTVRGPEDEQEFALSYIMEIIRAEFDDLVAYLKKNGGTVAISGVGGDVLGDAGGAHGNVGGGGGSEDSGIISVNPFDNVELGADSFNLEDVRTGPTARPTARPTREPTPSVAEEEVVVKVSGEDINVVSDDTTHLPWWTWLVLALAILLLCLCCICGCLWRRRRNERRTEKERDRTLQVWMGTDRAHENLKDRNRRKGASEKPERNDRSVAGTRRTSKARRPSRSVEVGEAASRRSFRSRSRRTSKRTSRRTSRNEGPASRRPIRRKSSTEIEEEEERECEERLRDDAASRAAASQAHKETGKDGADGSDGSAADRPAAAEARARDPPEELALVPYSSRLTDPDGMKVSRCSSMYAADLYYSAKTLDGSNRTGGPDGSNRSESVASRAQPLKAKRQAKDSLFVCTLDELPEEVQAQSRRTAERSGDEGPPMAAEQRRKRKKKKRDKGKKSGKAKKNAVDGKNDGRKRRSAVDRLRHSLKLSKVSQGHHQDIVVGAPFEEDEPSLLTLPRDLRGRNELEAGFRGERSAWVRGQSRATRERGRSVESLASDDERQRQSEADEGRGSKVAAMAKRRPSWASDAFGDGDGDDGSRGGHLMSNGSLGSEDIGL